MTTDETTLNSTAHMLAQAVASSGIDLNAFVSALGIGLDHYLDPNGRIPVSLMQRAWAQAVEWSGDPCFGLRLADVMHPTSLHGLGLAMVASSTLKDALVRVVRYQRIISTAFDLKLEEQGSRVSILIDAKKSGVRFHDASIDATGAVLTRMCRITSGLEVSPTEVSLRHPAPPCSVRFEAFYGCRVVFGAADNRLTMSRTLLEQTLPSANPLLAHANDEVVVRYLEELDSPSLTDRVRREIIDLLPAGAPREEQVARRLNLGLRSLQRQLQREGISYKQILEQTRNELAIRYLQEGRRRLTEIGFLLGFAEQASFSRAFKRWTGVPPQVYRDARTRTPE